MFHLLVLFNFLSLSYSSDIQNSPVLKDGKNNGASYISSRTNMIPFNRTFFDKSDNILRIPNTFHEEKRKNKVKKTPKRTIQKIIKKNTVKRKRLFVNLATREPTITTVYKNVDNIHSMQNEDPQTTEANSRRRSKKNSKVLRYHMPFHKLQPRGRKTKRDITDFLKKDMEKVTKDLIKDIVLKRNRRDTEGDNVVILNDLDEIEFVGNDNNDYDVVKAHVQYSW